MGESIAFHGGNRNHIIERGLDKGRLPVKFTSDPAEALIFAYQSAFKFRGEMAVLRLEDRTHILLAAWSPSGHRWYTSERLLKEPSTVRLYTEGQLEQFVAEHRAYFTEEQAAYPAWAIAQLRQRRKP
ncbi:MAG TPA: hypothetical protein VJK52_00415 [Candidatus Nanoarchaeia archaeon]|nr:hypothetical protein [Candidatus Nanoarchaeia archaeon]